MKVTLEHEVRQFSTVAGGMVADLQPLRSRIEAELGRPAVILVTSAVPGDGKRMTAASLTACFQQSGDRAALVCGGDTSAERSAGLSVVELPDRDGVALDREDLKAFTDSLRCRFDFTVIDGGTFFRSGAAVGMARVVDGILLSFRLGRAQDENDELMIRTIEHSGGRVLGVVTANAETILDFNKARFKAEFASERMRRLPDNRAASPAYVLPVKSLAQ